MRGQVMQERQVCGIMVLRSEQSMGVGLLSELGIEAEQATRLTSKLLARLLAYLLRWEDYAGALACLDAQGASALVSL
jgi:hypothetical protein